MNTQCKVTSERKGSEFNEENNSWWKVQTHIPPGNRAFGIGHPSDKNAVFEFLQ
jgi:hypothetical protein